MEATERAAPWNPQQVRVSSANVNQKLYDYEKLQRHSSDSQEFRKEILNYIARFEKAANRPYPVVTEIRDLKEGREIWVLKSDDAPLSYLVIIKREDSEDSSPLNFSIMRWSDFDPKPAPKTTTPKTSDLDY